MDERMKVVIYANKKGNATLIVLQYFGLQNSSYAQYIIWSLDLVS